jgi:hypothetical protein
LPVISLGSYAVYLLLEAALRRLNRSRRLVRDSFILGTRSSSAFLACGQSMENQGIERK